MYHLIISIIRIIENNVRLVQIQPGEAGEAQDEEDVEHRARSGHGPRGDQAQVLWGIYKIERQDAMDGNLYQIFT